MTIKNVSDLLLLPYPERRFVTLAGNGAQSNRKDYKESQAPEGGDQGTARKANNDAEKAMQVAMDVAIFGLAGPAVGLAAWALKQTKAKAAGSARAGNANLGVNVLEISTGAAQGLDLPPGDPRDKVVYAGHPLIPRRYFAIHDFHRHVFESKFAELVTLLMNLGVRDMEVRHIEGWGQEFAAELGIGLPRYPVGSINAGGAREQERSLLYKASFLGHDEPNVPPGLYWHRHESAWQTLAEGRIKFGLKDFSLRLHYKDDYGVNSSLALEVEKVGLKAGGSIKGHMSTTWDIRGSF